MKQRIFFLSGLFCLIALSSSAQTIEHEEELQSASQLKFEYTSTTKLSFDIKFQPLSLKTNRFLTGTGYLLQGLKFNSAIDQFNAISPFDFRAYKPLSFSSYSQTIQRNYLLAQPIQPIK